MYNIVFFLLHFNFKVANYPHYDSNLGLPSLCLIETLITLPLEPNMMGHVDNIVFFFNILYF